MRTFEIYYSGSITIEAENEADAIAQFESKYWNYGNIDDIDSIEDEEEMEEDD